ncbi:MAG: sigma factor-like helix-turn-helix DNA-binding protein, partial [Dehalococcoidia bacterium]
DHLRYQIRRDRAALSMPGRDNFAPGADESLDTLELLDAISKLTIDQQEVLILRFFMSLPARATAQMLGKNETAVFALQVRAIGALRRIMMPRGVSLEAVRAA